MNAPKTGGWFWVVRYDTSPLGRQRGLHGFTERHEAQKFADSLPYWRCAVVAPAPSKPRRLRARGLLLALRKDTA